MPFRAVDRFLRTRLMCFENDRGEAFQCPLRAMLGSNAALIPIRHTRARLGRRHKTS